MKLVCIGQRRLLQVLGTLKESVVSILEIRQLRSLRQSFVELDKDRIHYQAEATRQCLSHPCFKIHMSYTWRPVGQSWAGQILQNEGISILQGLSRASNIYQRSVVCMVSYLRPCLTWWLKQKKKCSIWLSHKPMGSTWEKTSAFSILRDRVFLICSLCEMDFDTLVGEHKCDLASLFGRLWIRVDATFFHQLL